MRFPEAQICYTGCDYVWYNNTQAEDFTPAPACGQPLDCGGPNSCTPEGAGTCIHASLDYYYWDCLP